MSKSSKAMRERLIAERDNLVRQRDALDSEIRGIERAISLLYDDRTSPSTSGGGRPQVKKIVLDLLAEVGADGLDAGEAVALASKKGLTIQQGSVSSNLSRLKKDGVLGHADGKYKLKRFVESSATQRPTVAAVPLAVGSFRDAG